MLRQLLAFAVVALAALVQPAAAFHHTGALLARSRVVQTRAEPQMVVY